MNEHADNIAGIDTLLNKDHCKSRFDLSAHTNTYFNDKQNARSIANWQNDAELESIFEAINENVEQELEPIVEPKQQPVLLVTGNVHDTDDACNDDDNISITSDISHTSAAIPISKEKLQDTLKIFTDYSDGDTTYDHTKYVLLDEIEEYQEQLIIDEIFNEKKYIVTINTPLKELREIRDLLKIKYDRTRFTNMGIKTIELLAFGLEKIFDGTRSIGSLNLDLTGWHKTMKLRSKYLRTDISECVETIINPTLPAGARICIDILLSMIYYGTTNHMSKAMKVQDVYSNLNYV